jgi:hypothetical protein
MCNRAARPPGGTTAKMSMISAGLATGVSSIAGDTSNTRSGWRSVVLNASSAYCNASVPPDE